MPLETGTAMPSLAGATEWLNATGASAEAGARGRATLVHFWSANCGDCREGLPRVAELRERHPGLHVVAVHTPHDEDEADAESVRDAVAQCNLSEPCAVDNGHQLRDTFGLASGDVPAYFLFDAEGKLLKSATGASGLETIAAELGGL
jgi:thiol-disulfide isomerase/thioredoxin